MLLTVQQQLKDLINDHSPCPWDTLSKTSFYSFARHCKKHTYQALSHEILFLSLASFCRKNSVLCTKLTLHSLALIFLWCRWRKTVHQSHEHTLFMPQLKLHHQVLQPEVNLVNSPVTNIHSANETVLYQVQQIAEGTSSSSGSSLFATSSTDLFGKPVPSSSNPFQSSAFGTISSGSYTKTSVFGKVADTSYTAYKITLGSMPAQMMQELVVRLNRQIPWSRHGRSYPRILQRASNKTWFWSIR